jgi:hypothetical protein
MKTTSVSSQPIASTLFALLLSLLAPGAAAAGDEVVYATFIGDNDRVNSAGERLTSVADVLRQDRANYHAGRGSRREEHDGGIFETRTGRAKFENYRIVLQNLTPSKVIRGDCGSVVVRVIGRTIYVEQVE